MEQDIRFNSRGVSLWGKFTVPQGFAADCPFVVMATGAGKAGSHSPTWNIIRSIFCDQGIPTFIFDFCGQGNSAGSISDLTLSVGVQNLTDAIAVVRAQNSVDPAEIALIGSSFGGNVCLLTAAEDQQISRMALKSPVSMWAEALERIHGPQGMIAWKNNGCDDRGFHYQSYVDSLLHNTYAAAEKIDCPVLIVHGDADSTVPIQQSKRLTECLLDSEFAILSGVDHQYSELAALTVACQFADWLTPKKSNNHSTLQPIEMARSN